MVAKSSFVLLCQKLAMKRPYPISKLFFTKRCVTDNIDYYRKEGESLT